MCRTAEAAGMAVAWLDGKAGIDNILILEQIFSRHATRWPI
jgi:hypothetical protein